MEQRHRNFYRKICQKMLGSKMYSIFQPILKVNNSLNAKIDSYEMLIRNEEGNFPGINFIKGLATANGNEQWITISEQSLQSALTGHRNRKVYINIEPCQMQFKSTWQFLEKLHATYQDQVAIELTERHEHIHSINYLDQEIERLQELGFQIAIDDVSAGSNSYAFIKRQLEIIQRIKLSLLIFNGEDEETVMNFIKAWLSFAEHHQLDFVIEGISDQKWAQQFAGNPIVLQQGYYWGSGCKNI